MSQSVTVVDGECGSCGAEGDVYFVRQSLTLGPKVEHSWVSRYCNNCFRELADLADRAVGEFSNEARRWPTVKQKAEV